MSLWFKNIVILSSMFGLARRNGSCKVRSIYIFVYKTTPTILDHLFIATKYEEKPETIDKWNRCWCLLLKSYSCLWAQYSLETISKNKLVKHMVRKQYTYKEKAMVIIPDKTIHPSHILWFMGCAIGLYKWKILWPKW